MDTVRVARDLGDVSTLLPEGVPLSDAPHNLVSAIALTLRFLGFEELPLDERPPKRIWLDGEALNAWWEEVERKRKAKYGIDGERDAGPMMEQDARSMLLID